MLRVYGITYDHTVNYGSCLQAFALQNAIEKIQLSDGTSCAYQLIPIENTKEWNAHPSWKSLLIQPIIRLHRAQFVGFERRYMHFAPVRRLDELPALNKDADAFVCGSDVIWGPDFNHGFDAFYLSFARKYKFSYAASFGKDNIGENALKKTTQFLADFDAISVREKSGAEIVQSCVNRSAQVVVDPVLLLQRDEWNAIIPSAADRGKYIYVYITHLSDSLREFVQDVQRKTGLKIIYAVNGPKQAISQGVIQVQKPERWLQLIRDAEYVITNSFHATAFSVLFHKRFFTVVSGAKDQGINVRMNEFLNAVGLGDRILSSTPDMIDLADMDYSRADEVISRLRNESLAFLRENLEAAAARRATSSVANR